jgi:hypothetical protein
MDFGTLWEAYLIEEVSMTQYTGGNGIATKNYNILLQSSV